MKKLFLIIETFCLKMTISGLLLVNIPTNFFSETFDCTKNSALKF